MTESCGICIEKYTKSTRPKISCNYCVYNACRGCIQKYLLTQVVDAHCMNCKTGWNREFLDTNFTKSFRTGEWRTHVKTMLEKRETAHLPGMQVYASAQNNIKKYELLLKDASKEYTLIAGKTSIYNNRIERLSSDYFHNNINEDFNIPDELNELIDKLMKNEKKLKIINLKSKNIHYKSNEAYQIYHGKTKAERKEFLMKCIANECRGFLSSAYKCELCEVYVCKDCMTIKNGKNDETHVCKDSDKESVALIRKETRPCPKCGIRISKIDGCDMMWCTAENCGTAFSWNTGDVMTGHIHNPHYYDWVRRNNNGVIPRNPGDAPPNCDAFVSYYNFNASLKCFGLGATTFESKKLSTIHQLIGDVEHGRLYMYPIARVENMYKDIHCDYLNKRLTQKEWNQKIFLKENAFEKKQQIGLILNTFITIGKDLVQKFYNEIKSIYGKFVINHKLTQMALTKENLKKITDFIEEFNELRKFINNSLLTVEKNMSCVVPQIKPDFLFDIARKRLRNVDDIEKVKSTT